MTRWKEKKVDRPQPVAVLAAGGILLFSLFLATMTGQPPRVRVASLPPETLPLASLELPRAAPAPASPFIGPPVPPLASEGPTSRVLSAGPALFPPLPATPPPALKPAGPEIPVRGPKWQGAPLPAFSPDLLQAMMDPRAARRALHLRRLGVVFPAATPAKPGPSSAPETASSAKITQPTAAPRGTAPVPGSGLSRPSPKDGPADALHATTQIARLQPSDPVTHAEPMPPAPTTPPADTTAKPTEAKPATGGDPGKSDPQAAGKSSEKTDAAQPASAAVGPPVQLHARLDPPRPEYRVGEWVALRFLASRPVHLRVYRIDAARQVTQVFSTYGRDEKGSPARTFSMMVKAGEPKPGQEGMIAIGSARPLTRDELLSCLRAYLAEAPADYPASAGSSPAPTPTPDSAAAKPAPLADAVKAVIDAVGRAADTPDAAAAPLDRSGWSIAVGHFVSASARVSDDKRQRSAAKPSA